MPADYLQFTTSSGKRFLTPLRPCGMSEGAVRVTLHRMRQRLGQLIREEIAETVPAGTDIDDEILNLRKTLGSSR